ncbi:MAG: hypothetical protein PQJ60_09410 [Spirochaetales bacterium]|nr:hypothetical protein [Spirochaetales bacterium]
MTFLVPITLYGWIPVTLYLFYTQKRVEEAILASLVYGFLFLPGYSYSLPMLIYNKKVALSLSLLLGMALKSSKKQRIAYLGPDLAVVTYCFLGPVLTSLSNGLGLYDGIYTSIQSILRWGAFYFMGRWFFVEEKTISRLIHYIFIGTIL